MWPRTWPRFELAKLFWDSCRLFFKSPKSPSFKKKIQAPLSWMCKLLSVVCIEDQDHLADTHTHTHTFRWLQWGQLLKTSSLLSMQISQSCRSNQAGGAESPRPKKKHLNSRWWTPNLILHLPFLLGACLISPSSQCPSQRALQSAVRSRLFQRWRFHGRKWLLGDRSWWESPPFLQDLKLQNGNRSQGRLCWWTSTPHFEEMRRRWLIGFANCIGNTWLVLPSEFPKLKNLNKPAFNPTCVKIRFISPEVICPAS